MTPLLRTLPALLVLGMLIVSSTDLAAQVTLRPSLGLQTFSFIGNAPAADPLAPVGARNEPLGGGFEGGQPGARLQLEISTDKDAILRFPLSLEYFSFDGKTTFSVTSRSSGRPQRLTFTHTGNILTANLGVTAAFFEKQKIYVSGELKGVYFSESNLGSRQYYGDTDETLRETSATPSDGAFRIGAMARVGAQLPFFDPFLLDFSAGIGVVNMLLTETTPDPNTNLNLFVIDQTPGITESNLQYFTIGMSIIWQL